MVGTEEINATNAKIPSAEAELRIAGGVLRRLFPLLALAITDVGRRGC